jgi:hypothetical protein
LSPSHQVVWHNSIGHNLSDEFSAGFFTG